MPPAQICEQHSVLLVHPASLGLQLLPASGVTTPPSGSVPASTTTGIWHALLSSPEGRHWVPAQHSDVCAQTAPSGLQVPPV